MDLKRAEETLRALNVKIVSKELKGETLGHEDWSSLEVGEYVKLVFNYPEKPRGYKMSISGNVCPLSKVREYIKEIEKGCRILQYLKDDGILVVE